LLFRPSTKPGREALECLRREVEDLERAVKLLEAIVGDGNADGAEEEVEELSEDVVEARDRVEEAMSDGPLVPAVKEELLSLAENVRRATEVLLTLVSMMAALEEIPEDLKGLVSRLKEVVEGLKTAVVTLDEDVEKAAEIAEDTRKLEEDVRNEIREFMFSNPNDKLIPILVEMERCLDYIDRALDDVVSIKIKFLG